MIKVHNTLDVYEVNGEQSKVPGPKIQVRSHWNRRDLVVLEVNGESYTVTSADLEAAIRNATNTASY